MSISTHVPRSRRIGVVLLCVGVALAILAGRWVVRERGMTLSISTWSCPASVDESLLRLRTPPEACDPIAINGDARAFTVVIGKPWGDVEVTTSNLTGSTTTITGIRRDGSHVYYSFPVVPGTATIYQIAPEPKHDPLAPYYSSVRTIMSDGRAAVYGNAATTGSSMKIDVFLVQSGLEPVPDATVSLAYWQCPGIYDTFDPSLCSTASPEPSLLQAPLTRDDAPGRIPTYSVADNVATYSSFDPVQYRFVAEDSALGCEWTQYRTLVLPVDGPQVQDANAFVTVNDADKYADLLIDPEAVPVVKRFNVYVFEAPSQTRYPLRSPVAADATPKTFSRQPCRNDRPV